MKKFARFFKNESGATAIEYGLIAALIAVAIIGGISAVGDSARTTFDTVQGQIDAGNAKFAGGGESESESEGEGET